MPNRKYACSRCGGSGRLPYNVMGGVCFKCGGTGVQSVPSRSPARRWAVSMTRTEDGETHHVYTVAARSLAEAQRKVAQCVQRMLRAAAARGVSPAPVNG